MEDSKGWVSLHRKISDNPLWLAEPFTRGQAWVDIFLQANHKDKWFIVRGNRVDVKRGQVGRSIKSWAKRWRWSQGKVSRFLTMLQTGEQIELQKSKLTTLITVVNYEQYQQNGEQIGEQIVTQTGNKRGTNGEQTGTNNNVNKDNKKEAPFQALAFLKSFGVEEKIAKNWLTVRKGKRLANTDTAFEKIIKKMEKTGLPLNDVFKICVEKSWGGFETSWLNGQGVDSGKAGKCGSACFSFQSCKDIKQLKLGKECGAFCSADQAGR